MALNNLDLEGLEIEMSRRPSRAGRVEYSTIPAKFTDMLKVEAPKVLADPDRYLIIKLPVRPDYSKVPALTAKPTVEEKQAHDDARKVALADARKSAKDDVDQLALYARSWGENQDPKLYITKVTNPAELKGEPYVRMRVRLDKDVTTRPGR